MSNLFNKIRKLGKTGYKETLNPNISAHILSQIIGAAIWNKSPLLVSRLGWLEAYLTGYYLENGKISESLKNKLWDTPGIFPATEQGFKGFCTEYTQSVPEVDVLGLMQCPYEKYLVENYMPKSLLCGLSDLEPYYHAEPWTKYLSGKRVLVIHPFAKSITSQYTNNRKNIFINNDILPEFYLMQIIPPHTLCGNNDGYCSLIDALQVLKEKVSSESFDVAIIGCGSYGLPIGGFIKKMGKVSVHLGGATQILFGIRGGRWDSMPIFQHLMNDSWVRPLEEERPPNWEKAEKGCYW